MTTQSRILRTADGGGGWTDVTPRVAGGNVAAFFLDGSTGWVAFESDGGQVTVLHTGDGGRNWNQGSLDVSNEFPDGWGDMQIRFVDAQHGWAMVGMQLLAGIDSGALYQTTDGGSTWNLQARGGFYAPFSFSSLSSGWAIGGHANSALYSSRDGGATWNAQSLPIPAAYRTADVTLSPPVFFGPLEGVLQASFLRHTELETVSNDIVFFVTHDGGGSWTPTKPISDPSSLDYTSGVEIPSSIVDPGHWVVDVGRDLWATADGGQTWSIIASAINAQGLDVRDITAIDFTSARTGWALTPSGGEGTSKSGPWSPFGSTLLKTTDGGATWIPQSLISQP